MSRVCEDKLATEILRANMKRSASMDNVNISRRSIAILSWILRITVKSGPIFGRPNTPHSPTSPSSIQFHLLALLPATVLVNSLSDILPSSVLSQVPHVPFQALFLSLCFSFCFKIPIFPFLSSFKRSYYFFIYWCETTPIFFVLLPLLRMLCIFSPFRSL